MMSFNNAEESCGHQEQLDERVDHYDAEGDEEKRKSVKRKLDNSYDEDTDIETDIEDGPDDGSLGNQEPPMTMNDLNDHVLEEIIKLFGLKERLKFMRLNSQFGRCGIKWFNLMTKINKKDAEHVRYPGENRYKRVAFMCPNLKSFDTSINGHNLHTQLKRKDAKRLAKSCPRIEAFEKVSGKSFDFVCEYLDILATNNHLKSIEIVTTILGFNELFEVILKNCLQFEKLKIRLTHSHKPIYDHSDPRITTKLGEMLKSFSGHLTYYEMFKPGVNLTELELEEIDYSMMSTIVSNHPNLIKLRGRIPMNNRMIKDLAKLEKIEEIDCLDFNVVSYSQIAKEINNFFGTRGQSVKNICLTGSKTMILNIMRIIRVSCPNLQEIMILGSVSTKVVVKDNEVKEDHTQELINILCDLRNLIRIKMNFATAGFKRPHIFQLLTELSKLKGLKQKGYEFFNSFSKELDDMLKHVNDYFDQHPERKIRVKLGEKKSISFNIEAVRMQNNYSNKKKLKTMASESTSPSAIAKLSNNLMTNPINEIKLIRRVIKNQPWFDD